MAKRRSNNRKSKKNAAAASSAPSPARDAVLNTTELLEGILKMLPQRHIAVCQRVSQHWSRAIQASPTLQHRILLDVEDSAVTFDFHWGEVLKLKRLHATKIRWRLPRDFHVPERKRPAVTMYMNPVIWELFWVHGDHFDCVTLKDPKADTSQASWREMSLTIPPVAKMFCVGNDGSRFGRSEIQPQGALPYVTVGDLLESYSWLSQGGSLRLIGMHLWYAF